MRFYDEVDAILTRSESGPAMGYEEQAEAGAILAGAMMGYEDDTDAITCPVNSYTAQSYEVIPKNEDKQTHTGKKVTPL